jgi:SAM-dependent methyltransferase
VSVFERLAVLGFHKVLSWRRPTPTQAFRGATYLRHNQRRQEHLATLGLPLEQRSVLEVGAGIGDHTGFFLDRGCRVVSTEAREENVAILRKRYPHIEVSLLDVEDVDAAEKRVFDIVYCYGLLYHLSRPSEAIAYLAQRSGVLLLLETCVSYGDNEAINPVQEQAHNPTQSVTGTGCRPTRPWVYRELRKHFDHVYMPLTQPNHVEFPLDWSKSDNSGRLTRAVFIASRGPLVNPLLMEGIPSRQVRDDRNVRASAP